MIISREVVIAIMVQMKLEFNNCKCERCSIDYQNRFADLVCDYINLERSKDEAIQRTKKH